MTFNNDENDDDDAWNHLTKHIQKLPTSHRAAPPAPPKRIHVQQRAVEKILSYRKGASYLQVGVSHDIDKSNAEKLKRGKYPIEGRLDLHGSTQEEAFKRLYTFVLHAYGQNKRCVLVVTGKGLREDGSKGIIRTNVPLWLNDPKIRPYILAFRHAKPSDGGEGALYVLLKREK